jgi:glutathione S-transferase
MITVHHLNDSRSQRILWLLEELGLPYEIRHYKRLETRLAPPELKAIHPVGKSPVVTDGRKTVFESGAIIDYVIRRHAGGRLQPDPATPAYDDYQMWMHYAEGSAMLPYAPLYVSGWAAARRCASRRNRQPPYLDAHLKDGNFLVGDNLTGADIQMSFIGEIAQAYGKRAAFPNLDAWVKRLHARPAYKKALEKGGPYRFAS